MSMVLTQRAVEAARPKAKRYGKADGIIPGLQLVLYPSGGKTVALFTRIYGRQVKFTLGSATVLTLAQARAEAKRKLGEIAAGSDPRAAKQEAVRAASETVGIVAQRHRPPCQGPYPSCPTRRSCPTFPRSSNALKA